MTGILSFAAFTALSPLLYLGMKAGTGTQGSELLRHGSIWGREVRALV